MVAGRRQLMAVSDTQSQKAPDSGARLQSKAPKAGIDHALGAMDSDWPSHFAAINAWLSVRCCCRAALRYSWSWIE